jgi:hypothetical protein
VEEATEKEDDLVVGIVSSALAHLAGELEEEDEPRQWGGSHRGKAPNKNRDFTKAHEQLVANYFSGDQSIYDEDDFERRFRMPRTVFNRLKDGIIGKGPFVLQTDAAKKGGIHPLVRLVACLRKLSYGDTTDREDENLAIGESTLDRDYKIFCQLVVEVFGKQHMCRSPTPQEVQRAQAINKGRGFPGLFASWDCKHFPWKLCPVALQGQHKGKESSATLVLSRA